ncbi:Rossmann-fold NAD(P)-binding domain-containing protein [Psychroflexus montanilacus]|uniref:acetylornithine carbamoyltransferase n=1 Tax=Psychroflexus montanilacus TaxID=2873598 RepID=UPI001CCB921F|nr:acetylornithine carbamoyltransferase [Psychroflexus montanilacus]MBZ9650765.1 acetylornithine carbamoyltransferase [Psychroflexus montanilacus]
MKNYTSISELYNLEETIQKAIQLKKNPLQNSELGKHKTLVMLFFNASLRTRLSTEKAARNLGMHVSILNVNEAWQLEFEDGTKMNTNTSEHIKEAARIISLYADIIAVRAFPSLKNKQLDESEQVLNSFMKYATVPILNMESATGHPLQALADALTITEHKLTKKPKVVLSWAPHSKALPQSVANSFVEMMQFMEADFSITHPKGYELNPKLTKQTEIIYNQEQALENADFVYVKNWSTYDPYGQILSQDETWMMTKAKLGNAKFMHCLPVRRNVVATDEVLDHENSLIIEQANNRTFAAQAVLEDILQDLKSS